MRPKEVAEQVREAIIWLKKKKPTRWENKTLGVTKSAECVTFLKIMNKQSSSVTSKSLR